MRDRHRGIAAIVGGSVAVFWYGAFVFGFPGVMSHDWQTRFQVGRGEIGTILFFVLAAVGILMFFVGKWQEKAGFHVMVSIGAVICGLDQFFIAFASELWMLYAWAFVMGAGSCFVYAPVITVAQRWYPTRRGLVSGLVNFTFGFAGAVMAPVFRYLLAAMDYQSMNLWLGVFALAIGLVAAQFAKAPDPEVSRAVAPSTQPTTAMQELERSLSPRQSIRTRSFRCLWMTWALQGAAGISMVTLSIAFGLSKEFSMESAVVILMGFNVCNGLGRIVSGYASDFLGRNSTMSVTFFSAGLSYFVLPHVDSLVACTTLAAVVGFSFGTLFAVSAPLAMDCFGIKHFGAIFGLTFTAYGFVAGPIGPSLSGYLLDITHGNFVVVFGYLGFFCLVSSVLIRFVTPPGVVPIMRGDRRL
jgi:MFS transporter, OFA family, oxalate/formate antiporter